LLECQRQVLVRFVLFCGKFEKCYALFISLAMIIAFRLIWVPRFCRFENFPLWKSVMFLFLCNDRDFRTSLLM
jgi:hypothetical protein